MGVEYVKKEEKRDVRELNREQQHLIHDVFKTIAEL